MSYLACVASSLELPEQGTSDQLRVMIERNLTASGHEPQNVQVGIENDEKDKEIVTLRDVTGVILMAEPEVAVETENEGGDDSIVSDKDREERTNNQDSEEMVEDQLVAALAQNKEPSSRNQSLSNLIDT